VTNNKTATTARIATKPNGAKMAAKRIRPRDPTKSAANRTYICHAI
jgi:hypothetical protein